MINNPPFQIQSKRFMIGWPVETIHHLNNDFVGFMMPLAFQDSRQLICLTVPTINTKKLDEVWLKYSKDSGIDGLVARLKLMYNIAGAVFLLHRTGKYVLKDFKPGNVLVTHSGEITIVDMDSIQITGESGLLFPGTAATVNYRPPEFYNSGTGQPENKPLELSWDYFALSVVFYQLLFGLHPYVCTPKVQTDSNCKEIFKNIAGNLFPFGGNTDRIESYPPLHDRFHDFPASLQKLFIRSFSLDTQQRPGADEWRKILNEIIKDPGKITVSSLEPDSQKSPNPDISNTKAKEKQDYDMELFRIRSKYKEPYKCPHCGFPVEGGKLRDNSFLWFLLGFILIFIVLRYIFSWWLWVSILLGLFLSPICVSAIPIRFLFSISYLFPDSLLYIKKKCNKCQKEYYNPKEKI
jgi:hypothetical protein